MKGEGWKNFTAACVAAAFYASTRKCPNFFFSFFLFLPTLFAALGSARRGFVLLSLSAAALPLSLFLCGLPAKR